MCGLHFVNQLTIYLYLPLKSSLTMDIAAPSRRYIVEGVTFSLVTNSGMAKTKVTIIQRLSGGTECCRFRLILRSKTTRESKKTYSGTSVE